MADDWIKFRKKLLRDGRVLKVSRSCRATSVTVIGALVTLWSLADDYADENGLLEGYTSDDINREVGIENFCESLPDDWMRLEGDSLYLPNYQEHNGNTAKRRAANSSRQKRFRDRNGSVTQVSRSERDKSVTREEKRREDNRTPKSPSGKWKLSDIRIPTSWDSEATLAAVKDWLAYKRKRGQPYKAADSLTRLLRRFDSLADFVAAVDSSISNNYAGCHPPTQSARASPAKQTVRMPANDEEYLEAIRDG